MKYRVAIYDLDYEIEARSTEGAIRAAIAHYAKTKTAQTMSRALLKMRSGRCGSYNTSSCCFVKCLFVRVV